MHNVRIRVAATAIAAIAMVGAGCGGSNDTTAALVVASPSPAAPTVVASVTPTATAATVSDSTADDPVDAATETGSAAETDAGTPLGAREPAEWVAELSVSLIELRSETRWSEIEYFAALQDAFGAVDVESARFRALAADYQAFVDRWPTAPEDLAGPAGAYRDAVAATAAELGSLGDDWDSDERIGERTNDVPAEVWDEVNLRQEAVLDAMADACFALQAVVDEAGFGIVDCLGSSDPVEPPTPEQCEVLEKAFGDGSVEECNGESPDGGGDTGSVPPGERVSFDNFAVPFSITTTQESILIERPSAVEIGPSENPWFEERFEVIWLEEIGDPEAMEPEIFALGPTIPVPEDLGLWMADLPIEIAAEGTSMFGDVEARWWRTVPPSDPIIESDVTDFYAFTDQGISVVTTLRRATTIWQIPDDNGDGVLIVYAVAVIENPDAVSMDEKFAFVEEALASFAFVG